MSVIEFLAIGIVIILFLCFLIICFSDCDMTLKYYEVFGTKLENVQGSVIWITGASTGIGASMAIEAARLGAKLVLSARTEEKLKEVKAKCLEVGSNRTEKDFLILSMDMCDFDSHKGCVDKALNHFGKINTMVHNAGRSQRARWEHTHLDVDRAVFDLNVFSVVNLTRILIPHFELNGGGNFVLMSSLAGKFGVPHSGTYTGSKHALHGYFESLRTEKLGTGINVTFLCPGPVFSNLLAIAATETPGEVFAGAMSPTDKRMSTERCARLSLIAMAHNLAESWITFFPILPLMYVVQYMPSLSKTLLAIVGPKFMQKLRDSKETVKTKRQ